MHRLTWSILIIFLALFACHVKGKRAQRSADRRYQSLLSVDNGQRWGTWGLKEMCPLGYYAAGFSLKVSVYFRTEAKHRFVFQRALQANYFLFSHQLIHRNNLFILVQWIFIYYHFDGLFKEFRSQNQDKSQRR